MYRADRHRGLEAASGAASQTVQHSYVLPAENRKSEPIARRAIPLAPASGFYLRYGKRWMDVLGSAVGLVIFAPVVLVAALAIWLESGRPILYRCTRLAEGGRPFPFYKFRTMRPGAEDDLPEVLALNEADGPVFKIVHDPRLTRIGRFLRTTSIDELPQLWNVMRGDMSLVGPRPPLPHEVEQYEQWQLGRLSVRPGLTCLWQIRGRSLVGFERWMRYDLEYIEKRGLWTDLKILVATVPAVLSRRGAY